MYPFKFIDKKPKPNAKVGDVQYLALGSEPIEHAAQLRASFNFHNRYLAKRRILRNIRRLRHDQTA